MQELKVDNIVVKNIVDIMYGPQKRKISFNGRMISENKYSILEKNGRRKIITPETFFKIIEVTNGKLK